MRSYLAFSAILWCRGVPIGVVYAGNNVKDSNGQADGAIMEQF